MNRPKCDCTIDCGDDPGIARGAREPCEAYKRMKAEQAKRLDVRQWQECAQAILDDPRVRQIVRAHASAEPKRDNPAWRFTHADLGYVLHMLERYARGEIAG